MKSLSKYLLPLVLGFAIGFLVKPHRNRPGSTIIVKTDTCVVYDTIVQEKPILRYSYIYDTIRTHFTTVEHDTVLVDVPIERKVYAEDSLYWASVSGWHCSLDTLILYPKETTITIRETIMSKPAKWSFGITAGPSVLATPSGTVHAGLGATIGLTYRF